MIGTLLAYALSVVGFQYPNGVFLQQPELSPNPNNTSLWVMVDAAGQSCKRINSAWARRATEPGGLSLSDYYGDRIYFLATTGAMYSRTQDGTEWSILPSGAWLDAQIVGDSWTQRAWLGEDSVFMNDPRPEYADRWYQLGPAKSCHVFHEASRTLGPAGILTVSLESGAAGVPGWSLSTGFAAIGDIELSGNWIP